MPDKDKEKDQDQDLDQDKDKDQDKDQDDQGLDQDKDKDDDGGKDDDRQDLSKELKGMKAQLDRLSERNEYLEKSLALQDKYDKQKTKRNDEDGDDLPEALKELDATLEPILNRRLKKTMDPIIKNAAESTERMDAVDFKMYLQAEHPEILEDETDLNSIYQEVDTVRRNAASRGAWMSREEAFCFVEGVRARKEKATRKKERKSRSAEDEKKRKKDRDLALNSDVETVNKKGSEGGIQAILEKARKGQVLTDDEQKKRRAHLENVTF